MFSFLIVILEFETKTERQRGPDCNTSTAVKIEKCSYMLICSVELNYVELKNIIKQKVHVTG